MYGEESVQALHALARLHLFGSLYYLTVVFVFEWLLQCSATMLC
jgi:hypothetical protein